MTETPEQLAQRFHETYERLAPDYGYKTREASAKPWDQVPDNNRALMTAVCGEILEVATQPPAAPDDAPADLLHGDKHDCCATARKLHGVHHDPGCTGPVAPIVILDGPLNPEECDTDCWAQATHYGTPIWGCMCCNASAVAATRPDRCIACDNDGDVFTEALAGPLDLDVLDTYGLLPDEDNAQPPAEPASDLRKRVADAVELSMADDGRAGPIVNAVMAVLGQQPVAEPVGYVVEFEDNGIQRLATDGAVEARYTSVAAADEANRILDGRVLALVPVDGGAVTR